MRPSLRPLFALCAVGAVAVGAVASTSASASGGATDVGSVSAHLRFTISTTSDWTQVHISPGRVVAQHVNGVSGTATTAPMSDGISVSGVSGGARIVVDEVLYEPSGAPSFKITVNKGYVGSAAVTIQNLNSAPVTVVNGFVDSVHSLTDASNQATTSVSRAALLTSTPMPMPQADHRKLVLAFYYPWWANYDDPRLADTPQDPRTSWNQSGVTSMTAQARAAGVNGFVVSYAGDNADGSALDAAMRAAQAEKQLFTGYVEVPRATTLASLGNADPIVVRNWLVQLLARSSSPSFLKASDGVPVVFVYGMGRLLPAHWRAILASLHTDYGLKVHLLGDETDSSYLPYEWGIHRYAANDTAAHMTAWSQQAALTVRAPAIVDSTVAPKVYVGTVSPGFDDHKLRGTLNPVIPRDNGATYTDSWNAALAGQPDWVVVTSWNEWYEDTEIEPGVATGSQALSQTASEAAAFQAG